ncbi:MAG: C39 family peptidase [Candidatus Veblenbacteria bacterium]|nr:C39 family peptidase [Candidatus Veblenbacteria bacterium]
MPKATIGLLFLLLLGASCQPLGIGNPQATPVGPEVGLGPELPVSETADDIGLKSTVPESSVPSPAPKPPEHTIRVLKVPFTSQAPSADWDMPYQEACEEASMIMVAEYLQGIERISIPAEEADTLILGLVGWETDHGYAVDLTAQEVVKVLAERYGIQAEAVPYSAEVIREELQAKRPVIVPAAGRLLGNPYFTSPGPLYHMLVIKGYEGNEFITNDPGTKRGESYRYTESALAYAVHDWNEGEVESGAQVMIVVR